MITARVHYVFAAPDSPPHGAILLPDPDLVEEVAREYDRQIAELEDRIERLRAAGRSIERPTLFGLPSLVLEPAPE